MPHVDGVLRLLALELRGGLGPVQQRGGVVQGGFRPFRDLFEMALPRFQFGRIDVEGNGLAGEPDRRQAGVRHVHAALHVLQGRADLRQRTDGIAREADDAVVREIGAGGGGRRQQRIGGRPVVERGQPGPRAPLAVAEGAVGVAVGVAGQRGAAVFDVRLFARALDDLRARARQGGGRLGEFRLVVVVGIHQGVLHHHGGDRRRAPAEPRVAQEPVVTVERAQVMAPRVAVPLRIEDRRLRTVDRGVVADDLVVHRVGHLAGGDALGEVPVQAVVGGRQMQRRRQLVGPAAQQGQFLVAQVGQQVVEAEERRAQCPEIDGPHRKAVAVVGVAAEPDGRIQRVGIGLVAEQHVEVVQAGGGQHQLLVGGGIVDAQRQAHGFRLVQNGLVELDQADAVQVVLVERDVALVRRPRLLDHADRGFGGIVVEILHALREGRDVVEHALHPALG